MPGMASANEIKPANKLPAKTAMDDWAKNNAGKTRKL